MNQEKRSIGLWVVTAIAVVFGALTIKSGGSVLFVDGAGRAAAGNYVGFVVWFNFLAGFGYIAAGVGLFQRRIWAPPLAAAIALFTLMVFAALGIHIISGGAFEQRTVMAMSVRTAVWVAIALFAYWTARPKQVPQGA